MRAPASSAALALAAAVLLLGAGCAAPVTPGAASPDPRAQPLPPRPQEIRIDGLDPCTTFTPGQIAALGVSRPEFTPHPPPRGDNCRWRRSPDEPVEAYASEVVTARGAGFTLGNSRGTAVIDVLGYPAVETRGEFADAERTCGILLDVADGQFLQISYSYNGSSVPMTQEIACGKARAAATLAMGNLLDRRGG